MLRLKTIVVEVLPVITEVDQWHLRRELTRMVALLKNIVVPSAAARDLQCG